MYPATPPAHRHNFAARLRGFIYTFAVVKPTVFHATTTGYHLLGNRTIPKKSVSLTSKTKPHEVRNNKMFPNRGLLPRQRLLQCRKKQKRLVRRHRRGNYNHRLHQLWWLPRQESHTAGQNARGARRRHHCLCLVHTERNAHWLPLPVPQKDEGPAHGRTARKHTYPRLHARRAGRQEMTHRP